MELVALGDFYCPQHLEGVSLRRPGAWPQASTDARRAVSIMILLNFGIATNQAPAHVRTAIRTCQVALRCYSGVAALPDSPEAVAITRKARPARRAFHLRYRSASLHRPSYLGHEGHAGRHQRASSNSVKRPAAQTQRECQSHARHRRRTRPRESFTRETPDGWSLNQVHGPRRDLTSFCASRK